MAGVLQFSLGLETSNFLRSIGVASGSVLSFAAISNGVRTVANHLWDAVERGGKLTDMAAAAAVSVGELYKLQRGLENVGSQADGAANLVVKLRRAIGGEGADALKAIGLDPETLGRSSPTEQLAKISEALGKLGANSRASAAFKIFGREREGANAMLQIANSGRDFASAMERAAADASVWDNVSSTFDAMADKVSEIKAHLQTLWATLAGALIQSFKDGSLAETIFDIFNTAFDALGAALPSLLLGGLVKVGESLLRILSEPFMHMVTMIDQAILKASKFLGFNVQDQSYSENLEANKAALRGLFPDMSEYALGAFKEGAERAGKVFSELGERLSAKAARLRDETKKDEAPGIGEDSPVTKAAKFDNNLSALEKIGFVLGGNGAANDPARSTAESTRMMLAEQRKTNAILSKSTNSLVHV